MLYTYKENLENMTLNDIGWRQDVSRYAGKSYYKTIRPVNYKTRTTEEGR